MRQTEYKTSRRGRTPTPKKTTDQLVAEIRRLASAARRAAAAATRAADDLARGTGDVTAQARAASGKKRSEPVKSLDEAPPEKLFAEVERLLRQKPHTEEELMLATGARRNRVRGALVHFSRFGPEVQNIGKPRRAQWWIPRE